MGPPRRLSLWPGIRHLCSQFIIIAHVTYYMHVCNVLSSAKVTRSMRKTGQVQFIVIAVTTRGPFSLLVRLRSSLGV